MTLVRAAKRVVKDLEVLEFAPPVACVYNPLEYAWRPHREYLERFGHPPKRTVLLGMNPGPFGMAQTGVPFGEVELVRDWIGIHERVDRPEHEHEKRPIEGFECRRSEVSGRRLWGLFRDRFRTPERFFRHFFVHNYCPLVFMEASGRNLTPDKLRASERDALFEICDRFLRTVVTKLEPQAVIGVGAFAEKRARLALADLEGIHFGRIPHPSPASPAANRGWAKAASAAFEELGIPLAAGGRRS